MKIMVYNSILDQVDDRFTELTDDAIVRFEYSRNHYVDFTAGHDPGDPTVIAVSHSSNFKLMIIPIVANSIAVRF